MWNPQTSGQCCNRSSADLKMTRFMRLLCVLLYSSRHCATITARPHLPSPSARSMLHWPEDDEVHATLVGVVVLLQTQGHDVVELVQGGHLLVHPLLWLSVRVHVVAEHQATQVLFPTLNEITDRLSFKNRPVDVAGGLNSLHSVRHQQRWQKKMSLP